MRRAERTAPWLVRLAAMCLAFAVAILAVPAMAAGLADFLGKAAPSELVPGADAYGDIRADLPAVPALKGGNRIGWVFLNTDFVPATGYSGKPINILIGVDDQAVITGVRLVKHSEPIVLVGIPEAKIKAVIEKYTGLDLKREANGPAHDLDIVSGATVTIMVIDDSIRRAGLKAARALGLEGFGAGAGPVADAKVVDRSKDAVTDWTTLLGDGSVRRFSLSVAEINAAFDKLGDPRAADHREAGADTDPYIDIYVGLASQPSIGRTLLGEAAYANLVKQLGDGGEAIFVASTGHWSFKGSGYVRGGIFDRITLLQGEATIRFRDKEHMRVVRMAPADSPNFNEVDLFVIPKGTGFDPAAPWRLQLLVSRAVGALEKLFLTYDVDYTLPPPYLAAAPKPAPAAVEPAAGAAADVATAADEAPARDRLWLRIWEAKRTEVIILSAALAALTGIFFFQTFATRNERVFKIIRLSYLAFTLVFVGWYANAQLSVVNLLAVLSALVSDFRWETFLMDPLIFILWFAVAAALLFWARGAYCGWLCPFGALQEWSNQIARWLRVPQIRLPWGLHERLWPIKYMIFLGLLGISFYSLDVAEHYAEIEPFKTAIILKFDRPWPYILIALAALTPGLFIERFYCRYVCPLGGGLAIPARLHMFRWLKRYRECGNPCQTCAHECPVQAIHPTGEINPNECVSCLHCQVLYRSADRCPVVIGKLRKRERFERQNGLVRTGAAAGAGTAAALPAGDAAGSVEA
ncbi:NosR/NirI family protein [Pleomorphomonas koreensis]|uniref:NosR/NirI family protein n=1 Tax=Pleomorphomonas koreensis TaxID=257440 RepID=UPI000419DE8C|nr:NosR/NirI family protein [Pleomorphomonas koreensis]